MLGRPLPACYGAWNSVHRKFKRGGDRGFWQDLFTAMQREPNLEPVVIDSTIVGAHACAAGWNKGTQSLESLGRSVGGFSTKIPPVVDGLGNPLDF